MSGCAAMRVAAWQHWPTRAQSPRAARTRWPRSPRPGWCPCVANTPDGDHDRSAPVSPMRASIRCRDSRRSIGLWCATTCSNRHHASAPVLTTNAGSDRARWSSGRWTSSDASISPTEPRSRWSPASMTTHAFASVPRRGAGHSPAGVRGAAVGAAHPWSARRNSH